MVRMRGAKSPPPKTGAMRLFTVPTNRKLGFHFHFWSLIGALVPPALVYLLAISVEDKMEKTGDGKKTEQRDLVESLIEQDFDSVSSKVADQVKDPQERASIINQLLASKLDALSSQLSEVESRLEIAERYNRISPQAVKEKSLRIFNLVNGISPALDTSLSSKATDAKTKAPDSPPSSENATSSHRAEHQQGPANSYTNDSESISGDVASQISTVSSGPVSSPLQPTPVPAAASKSSPQQQESPSSMWSWFGTWSSWAPWGR